MYKTTNLHWQFELWVLQLYFLNYAHAWYINTSWAKSGMERWIIIISKIQLVVYIYQCRILIGWATTRLYVIAH